MKLLTKTSRYYLLFTSLIFLACGVTFYLILEYLIIKKADESLMADKALIAIQLDETDDINHLFLDLTDDYHLKEISIAKKMQDHFTTIEVYDNIEEEYEPFRQLITSITKNGNSYELIIRKSLMESNDLIYSIAIVVLIMFTFLTVSLILFNRSVSSKIWYPFNQTLEQLKKFNVDGYSEEKFRETNITEFSELNKVAKKLTRKIKNDYLKQKEFIDNVTHEIQTPLAIINANIDTLIQSNNLKEDDIHIIQVIHDTVNRLAKINDSLLLLSKIENEQFPETKPIELIQIIEKYLSVFERQINTKHLSIDLDMKTPIKITMNPDIAEILIGNLIQNAIRHNVDKGLLSIKIIGNVLEIANTGSHFEGDPNNLFEKFVKYGTSNESSGLGLAIVRQICKLYHLNIEYNIHGHIHRIKLSSGSLDLI
ncbi:MAG: HAMP domain-containing histidine kinase [Vicingus serpentipes]|nr:HAMP domain-containing histidine kinase [Vicingus serpentipes]